MNLALEIPSDSTEERHVLLRRIPLLVAAVLVLVAPAALAEPPPDFEADREAGYLGISAVFVQDTVSDGIWKSVGGGVPVGNGGGFSARMGYRMIRWAAAEIEGDWASGLGDGVRNPWNITANLKAIYPFGPQDRIQPFIVGGAGVISAEIIRGTESSIWTDGVWKIGGGIDFFATRNWVATVAATWVDTMSSGSDLSYIGVKAGITYTFR
jgi:opacity protein-like surface antigen